MRLPGRGEAFHDTLASSGRLMAVFGSAVQTSVLPVLNHRHHCSFGSGIVRHFIGDHHARSHILFLEQPAQQALGCFRNSATLNQNVEHEPVRIDSAPQPVLLAGDGDDNLIKVPFGPDAGKWRRIWLAKLWPNFCDHRRTVSRLTRIPRAASTSSTIRRLSGSRKYNQTAWLMTSVGSGGGRCEGDGRSSSLTYAPARSPAG